MGRHSSANHSPPSRRHRSHRSISPPPRDKHEHSGRGAAKPVRTSSASPDPPPRSRSSSPRTKRLKKAQSEREREGEREPREREREPRESDRNHSSGRGRGSERDAVERKEKKRTEEEDGGGRSSKSSRSRHERSPERDRNGRSRHRSPSPPRHHASTSSAKPRDEVSGDIQLSFKLLLQGFGGNGSYYESCVSFDFASSCIDNLLEATLHLKCIVLLLHKKIGNSDRYYAGYCGIGDLLKANVRIVASWDLWRERGIYDYCTSFFVVVFLLSFCLLFVGYGKGVLGELCQVMNSRGAEEMDDENDSIRKMKAAEEALEEKQKQKPSFELSGKLAAETNRVRGVTLLFNEPPEARKPDIKWRLYVFKAGEVLNEPLYIHRQSCYLFGRERRVADIPTDHPSCSKQHAVIQFRQVENEQSDGTLSKQIRPYIMDLGSTNKTFVNDSPVEPQRYYELREKDTIKFGNSSREYVLLHENSIG
ncbi:hypothetical protein VNO77_42963 [Canavalia gladiata]|uniref:FHA domain-containing protein n=1 Tax=Canavalia gladiata TaxID=3824 RepID=A0AAN9JWV0_CANGL